MWMFTEWGVRKQPSILGMINGAIAGLVCITPAAGTTTLYLSHISTRIKLYIYIYTYVFYV
jgi:ammonia channel protein AmtB